MEMPKRERKVAWILETFKRRALTEQTKSCEDEYKSLCYLHNLNTPIKI